MDVTVAKNMAVSLMKEHGLLYRGWQFEFNTRKGAYGVCAHSKKIIYLSILYTRAMKNPNEVKNIILHEIAHALVGSGHGHNYVWRRKALEIGCDGQRCNTYELEDKHVSYKYLATCPCCGKAVGVSRKPKRTYWHLCNTGFKPENKLHFVQQY